MRHKIIISIFMVWLAANPINLSNAQVKELDNITVMELEEISDLLMSPGCGYKYTVTNCPSVAAIEFKELIKGKLVKGDTKEEILQYFLDTYGPRILAAPPKKGFSLLAWWLPYFVIADAAIIIGIIVFFWQKKARSIPSSPAVDSAANEEYEREIEDELKKMDL
ncbi:MAG: cytochrome c-type biogenesis protein CcmH [Thermodesulfobacteriota bacterium]